MEPVGLALGVIGLAGAFKSCVELFGQFSTYRSYGDDYNLLDAKLHIEKAVLLQWADRVRLLHEDYDRRLDNPTTLDAVSRVLSSITHLLSETSFLQQRYGMKQEAGSSYPLIPQRQTIGRALVDKFMEDFNAMQVRIHQRKVTTSTSNKLKWMIVDKDKFKNLIEDLSHFAFKLALLLPEDSTERDVSSLASLVRNEMASIYEEHAKALLQASEDRQERNHILQEARNQDRALKSLWFRCMGDRKDSVEPAHVKTLQWALKAPYEKDQRKAEWDDLSEFFRSGTGLYWVCGKAGSGKSTLMKYLHDNPETRVLLNAWAGDLPLTIGSFFFWGLGTQEQKSLSGLTRAILYQLLEAESSYIPSTLPRLWQEVRTNVHKQPEPPSVGELRAASEFMVKKFQPNRRFCLFIDGLDEFEGNYHDAIKLIKGLCSNSAIKIMVSSRPIAICHNAFSRSPQLHMEDLTRNDIVDYIHDIVGSHSYMEFLRSSGEQSPQTITKKLIDKSSGVFLWVTLACRSILDGFAAYDTVEELCQRVDDLPPELEGLFVHMLNSVDRRYHEWMAKALKILHTKASQHVVNNWEALDTIAFACFDKVSMDCTSNIPLQNFSGHEARKLCSAVVERLRSRCGGLLKVEPFRPWGRSAINFKKRPTSRDQANTLITDQGRKAVGLCCWCPLSENCSWVRGSGHPLPLTHKSEGYPEHSQIRFLHRTVVEFLNKPDVWNLAPLRISDSTFSAPCALEGMTLQVYYLYCKNGTHASSRPQVLRKIDREPLNCVLPVLGKLADYLRLKITQKDYTVGVPVFFSPFQDPAYNRSSPQLALLLTVELGMMNTVGSLLSTIEPHLIGPPYFPFPLVYHSWRSPVLWPLLSGFCPPPIQYRRESWLELKTLRYLVDQGFSLDEAIGQTHTTPRDQMKLLYDRLLKNAREIPPHVKHPTTEDHILEGLAPLIEHGAVLKNAPFEIPVKERVLDGALRPKHRPRERCITDVEYCVYLQQCYEYDDPLDPRAEKRRTSAVEALAFLTALGQVKKTVPRLDGSRDTQTGKGLDDNSNKTDTGSDPEPATAQEAKITAAEALASSAASEQEKGADTQLGSSLNAQAEKEADDNSNEADTGSDPKRVTGHKLNLKAVQDALWWVLLFVILALSMYLRPGLVKQANP